MRPAVFLTPALAATGHADADFADTSAWIAAGACQGGVMRGLLIASGWSFGSKAIPGVLALCGVTLVLAADRVQGTLHRCPDSFALPRYICAVVIRLRTGRFLLAKLWRPNSAFAVRTVIRINQALTALRQVRRVGESRCPSQFIPKGWMRQSFTIYLFVGPPFTDPATAPRIAWLLGQRRKELRKTVLAGGPLASIHAASLSAQRTSIQVRRAYLACGPRQTSSVAGLQYFLFRSRSGEATLQRLEVTGEVLINHSSAIETKAYQSVHPKTFPSIKPWEEAPIQLRKCAAEGCRLRQRGTGTMTEPVPYSLREKPKRLEMPPDNNDVKTCAPYCPWRPWPQPCHSDWAGGPFLPEHFSSMA